MFFSSLMYVLTFVLGGYFAINGVISVGLIVSLSQLIGGVVSPLERFPSILSEIYSTKEIKNKIIEIIEANYKKYNEIKLNKRISNIIMKNVSFSYKSHDRLVLRNININFESKKRYAVVGESGSGKSTLVKLLLKFYKCTAGDIEINKLNPCSLYKSIRYISRILSYFMILLETI